MAIAKDMTAYTADANADSISTFQLGPPSADLALTATGPATAVQGSTLRYDVTITNHEPLLQSPSGTVVVQLPAILSYQAVGSSSACSVSSSTVTCSVGLLEAGATTSFVVNATATGAGTASTTLRINGALSDPRASNDFFTVTTPVSALAPGGPVPAVDRTPPPKMYALPTRVTVRADGRFTATITCPATEVSCTTLLFLTTSLNYNSLRLHRRLRPVKTVIRARVVVRGGHSRTVTLRLPEAVRAAVSQAARHHKPIRAILRQRTADAAGNYRKVKRVVLLRGTARRSGCRCAR